MIEHNKVFTFFFLNIKNKKILENDISIHLNAAEDHGFDFMNE